MPLPVLQPPPMTREDTLQITVDLHENRAASSRRPTKFVKQQVELQHGEFIVDIHMNEDYLQNVEYHTDLEFTSLRYSAVTSDADDFPNQFSLRQKELRRKTKIAVVCTMYNEDDQLFTKTMAAVMDNIAYLCGLNGRKGWHSESWKDIVVVIVQDGVKPCNTRTLDVLGAMGCYMEGLQRSNVNGKDVQVHLYEFTTQVRIDHTLIPQFVSAQANTKTIVPMQTIFLLKEKNGKKINSHRWFFNAVCKVLDSEVCILLDIGTKPSKESFYHLYRAFERNQNVAGACGEITPDLGPGQKNLMNPLVAVQNFEYKISNILDKPLESMFGFIAVLPGAFSAYRYQALQGKPLEMYFKGEKLHNNENFGKPNVSESNMYLAEDRVLCFELVMKHNKSYILKYVKSARAETDVPTEISDLLKQRRRWLNGAFFASAYSIGNFMRIFQSSHFVMRKVLLLLETGYNALSMVFTWFSISSLYCCFFYLLNIASTYNMASCTSGALDSPAKDPFYPYGGTISSVLRGVYIAAFFSMVILSLGAKPGTVKPYLFFIACTYATLTLLTLVIMVWACIFIFNTIPSDLRTFADFIDYLPSDTNFFNLVVSLCCSYGMYILSGLMYLDFWHPFTSMIQYLLFTPNFSNMLMVYAFCNIHDISWGTKGLDTTPIAPIIQTYDDDGRQIATTDIPDPDYANELNKLMEMHIEHHNPHAIQEIVVQKKSCEEHFQSYRTFVLLGWFLTNFALTYFLTEAIVLRQISKPGEANPFLVVLLWSIVGFTAVR
ncbi:UNVERIFIED_CONTAM: Chitin synthase, class 1, partial [Siphonaria sp. JEL0065]